MAHTEWYVFEMDSTAIMVGSKRSAAVQTAQDALQTSKRPEKLAEGLYLITVAGGHRYIATLAAMKAHRFDGKISPDNDEPWHSICS